MRQLTLLHPTAHLGLLLFLAWALNGCGGGYSASAGTATLNSISITPSSATIPVGLTASLTATGNYTNGTTTDLTTSVVWTSADSTTASVASSGVVTANTIGTTSITASMSSMYGPVAATDLVTVTGATLSNFTLTPVTLSLARGSTATFTATGAFTDGSSGNISGSVTWNSSDPGVATVNASGIVTGVAAGGPVTITAVMGGSTNTATLTVF